MAVVIAEIVTEVAVTPSAAADAPAGNAPIDVDAVVRQATERVLETLRREWDL